MVCWCVWFLVLPLFHLSFVGSVVHRRMQLVFAIVVIDGIDDIDERTSLVSSAAWLGLACVEDADEQLVLSRGSKEGRQMSYIRTARLFKHACGGDVWVCGTGLGEV